MEMRYKLLILVLAVLPATVVRAQAHAANDAGGVQVELLEQGAQPFQKLRYIPRKGAETEVVMTMDMQQVMSINGAKLPAPTAPTQRFTIKFSVLDVKDDGTANVSFEYTDVDVVDNPEKPSPIAENVRRALAPLKGMRGVQVVDNRWFTRECKLELPDGLAEPMKSMMDGMTQSLENLSSPFPEEAIGLGGKWKVIHGLELNGIELTQTVICTLDSIKEHKYYISSTISQQAEPQDVDSPMLPPGTTLQLMSIETDGGGQLVVSPNLMVPLSSKGKVHSKTQMNVIKGETTQKMSTDARVLVTLQVVDENGDDATVKDGSQLATP